MSAISRGARNAFRNPLRTLSVTVILGISLGLIVVMLAARSAVNLRIAEVKKSIGNTVSVSPAGARGFLGGGEPLTSAQVDGLQSLPHVTSVAATIDSLLQTDTDTSLKSAIEAGTLGGRQRRAFGGTAIGGGGAADNGTSFTPPIFSTGTNSSAYGGPQLGEDLKLSSGKMFDATANANEAVIGKNLADKNSLVVGSKFQAFKTDITVVGIFDASNEFANNSVLFPLQTLQRLSGQADEVTAAIVKVDSVDQLASVTSAIKSKIGNAADVTSSQDSVDAAVKPLENIRTIATTSLIGALVAATVIILLTMVMIVRERRKEIAVLKAIGAGDGTIVTQFMTESVMMSLVGSVIGGVLGLALSNPILHTLLTSNTTQNFGGPDGGPARGVARIAVGGFRAVQGAVRDLQAVVDWHLLIYGVAAAIIIAMVGSAFPAWLIAKIRPAEVLRSE